MIIAKFNCETPEEMLGLLIDLEGGLDEWSPKVVEEWETKVYMMPNTHWLIIVILNKDKKWKH